MSRARGRFNAGGRLDRHAEGERVSDRGIAGDSLGELDAAHRSSGLEKFFDSLVHKEQPRLEVHNRFAFHVETKMSGLNDAGVNRANRDLVRAFPLHLLEWERRAV